MSEPSEDFLASLATEPWRPRSMQAPREASLAFRWRVLVLVAIALLHVLLATWLLNLLERDEPVSEMTTVIEFVDAVPSPKPVAQGAPKEIVVRPPRKRTPIKRVTRAPTRPTHAPRVSPLAPRVSPKVQADPLAAMPETRSSSLAQSSEPPSIELQLYNSDGRVRVPDDMLKQIDKEVGDQRVFSYQIPHIDDAKKYFYRNPALAFETTRFDQYWTPDQDALTALLNKLVEKTTKEVKIPVPGRPGSTMVCTVSILALGGGCGIMRNDYHYVGPVDDPNTLTEAEDRQCQAWWNQIIGAKTQDVWRKTRSLYEAECRKPLLRQQ